MRLKMLDNKFDPGQIFIQHDFAPSTTLHLTSRHIMLKNIVWRRYDVKKTLKKRRSNILYNHK